MNTSGDWSEKPEIWRLLETQPGYLGSLMEWKPDAIPRFKQRPDLSSFMTITDVAVCFIPEAFRMNLPQTEFQLNFAWKKTVPKKAGVVWVTILKNHSHQEKCNFYADCTCNSRNDLCEHALSALTQFQSAARIHIPNWHELVAKREIFEWLDQLNQSSTQDQNPPTPAKFNAPSLVYVLKPSKDHIQKTSNPQKLAIHQKIMKNGELRIDSRASMPRWNPDPPEHLSIADIEICSLIASLGGYSIGYSSKSEFEMRSPRWGLILEKCMNLGQLARYRKAVDGGIVMLRQGPTIEVKLDWKTEVTGSRKPCLDLPKDDLTILYYDPLFYIDNDTHEIGKLIAPIPAQMLSAWINGPEIPATYAVETSKNLRKVIPDPRVPTPVADQTPIVHGDLPHPHLFITRSKIPFHSEPITVGLLTFRYPELQNELPHQPSGNIQPALLKTQSGVAWFLRNSDAEQQLAGELLASGLLPITEFTHESVPANSKISNAFLFSLQTDVNLEWANFLASDECEILRQQGWGITSDPSLPLDIHNIEDWFSELDSETGSGIDWFRFDLSGMIDGQRVSLMPQIARAIREDWHEVYADPATRPPFLLLPCQKLADGFVRFPSDRFLELIDSVRHLAGLDAGDTTEMPNGAIRLSRIEAALLADRWDLQQNETLQALATLGKGLREVTGLPEESLPTTVQAELRHYQLDGFRWLKFLATHSLNGILADDMGLGKTLQALSYLAACHHDHQALPSLVIAPTSVVPNWAAEAEKFVPSLRVLVHHGSDRHASFSQIADADLVVTSYPLLMRDADALLDRRWHTVILDEAQWIKNSKAQTTRCAYALKANHRICLSGTPMENHLGELWSIMRFLMPGLLADEISFTKRFRRPIEKQKNSNVQRALNARIAPLILRRTKDQVASELPEKTTLIHHIDLGNRQQDLYESVRALMDKQVRTAISKKGLAGSHIIFLTALLKLRQICCHPHLLNTVEALRVQESAKLKFLTDELLPQLLDEGRRILLFSQFTSMLEIIAEHLTSENIPYLMLTGASKNRGALVKEFQKGEVPIFLISLKAGGTGLNLTAADTVIHYDPWWNPAAENQATDRAHRIGQTKPVFVHKLICRGTIEDRILELQERKADLVSALLAEETTQLRIDEETLSHLLAPMSALLDS